MVVTDGQRHQGQNRKGFLAENEPCVIRRWGGVGEVHAQSEPAIHDKMTDTDTMVKPIGFLADIIK